MKECGVMGHTALMETKHFRGSRRLTTDERTGYKMTNGKTGKGNSEISYIGPPWAPRDCKKPNEEFAKPHLIDEVLNKTGQVSDATADFISLTLALKNQKP